MAGRTPTLPSVTEFPFRLKIALAARGQTQKALAEALGISQNTLTNIMRGATSDPGISLLHAIAAYLDVSTEYLMGFSDQMERR